VDEFELIKTFFHNKKNINFALEKGIVLGIGDDAAVFNLSPKQQVVSSLDTLVEGVHFPIDTHAKDVAYKALAVNLSDLAAMGATPHSFMLSITLPRLDQAWLADFSEGLFELANHYQLVLLGGDTSKGPLSISIQINGVIDTNKYLTRSAALSEDVICVSGHLGLAALGLQEWQAGNKNSQNESELRLLRPQARVNLAKGFYELGIRCCIDVSDGLLSEINHLCQASHLNAVIDLDALLIHKELRNFTNAQQKELMLAGDDYELCFSVPKNKITDVEAWFEKNNIQLNKLGEFVKGIDNDVKHEANYIVTDVHGKKLNVQKTGYTHF
jgi:thiamine-monophosphate kinase